MVRFRCLIQSEVVIHPSVTIFNDISYKIFDLSKIRNPIDKNNDKIRVLDIISQDTTDQIKETYLKLLNLANEYLDILAYTSYSVVEMIEIVSICNNIVKPGEKFKLAISTAKGIRRMNNINLCTLFPEGIPQLNKLGKKLLSIWRLGFNSLSFEERFIYYYTILEEIAREYSDEKSRNYCPKCKEYYESSNVATNNFIKKLFLKNNLKTEDFENTKKIRHKLAHGEGERGIIFFTDINKYLPLLEMITMNELNKIINLPILNNTNLFLNEPNLSIFECEINNGKLSFKVLESDVTGTEICIDTESQFKSSTSIIKMPVDPSIKPPFQPYGLPWINKSDI